MRIDQLTFTRFIAAMANVLANGTPTGADRLGLDATEAAEWETYRASWNALQNLHQNEATRTKAVNNERKQLRKDFAAFASPLLTALSVHANLTEADRLAFRLPRPDKVPTARGKITDAAYAIISPVGGGSIQVKVRTSEDASRASRHPLADAVEVRYALLPATAATATAPQDPTPPAPAPVPTTGADTRASLGTALPVSAVDCPLVHISKKANFRIELGPQHSGKRFYAFFRWVNLSNLANSGDWGLMYQTLVL
jgi:hypothetical protein